MHDAVVPVAPGFVVTELPLPSGGEVRTGWLPAAILVDGIALVPSRPTPPLKCMAPAPAAPAITAMASSGISVYRKSRGAIPLRMLSLLGTPEHCMLPRGGY